MPHRGRVQPSQDDTIQDLHEALKKAPTNDCIIMMGDLNEQLPGNINNHTGKWVGGKPSKNAEKILELKRMYDLYAANTHFEPKQGQTVHTYLKPKCTDENKRDDFGLYVGERVKCKYKGNEIGGEVIAVEEMQAEQDSKWTVKFDDGYTSKYGTKQLGRMLNRAPDCKRGRQIDYILVSNRWRSSITDSKPRWTPSIHRSITGCKSDHALVECKWKWRMRREKPKAVPDFDVLSQKRKDGNGKPRANKYVTEFGKVVKEKMRELQHSKNDSATQLHYKMCTAITQAINEVLPKAKRRRGPKRKVSDETKRLYETRSKRDWTSKADLKKLQQEIRQRRWALRLQDVGPRMR